MKLHYKISITNPDSHLLQVTLKTKKEKNETSLKFFLPSWSPGSYLMREYGKNVKNFRACVENGEPLYFEQIDKGVYKVDWSKSDLKKSSDEVTISYDVFCHELTVRTSHIDRSHAFLHGPSILMGVLDKEMNDPEIEIQFPPLWSKLTTGLKDISNKRETFLYTAKNYDELIDAPIEIGCHETDGFRVRGIDHELAFFGQTFPHEYDLKADIQKIVEHVTDTMKDIPYEKYTFITHFSPGLYGGLEHLNSTALHFCSRAMTDRKNYVKWLELVAHEFFHTWNVKRIRPLELGPFDYLTEAKTRMHWLTEGLTSYMDQAFILRTDFTDLNGYLEMMKENLNRYYSIPGRHFHSLEDSSFNSWIKLYRPDENSDNSSVSYYLKGGLVFFVLNIAFAQKGKSMIDLLDLLWERYKEVPEKGMVKEEVLAMIEKVGGKESLDLFEEMLSTTKDIDFESYFNKAGVEVEWSGGDKPWFGFKPKYVGDRMILSYVELDSPAFKGGLNAEDEILAINGMRMLKDGYADMEKFILPSKKYTFTVSRLGYIQEVEVVAGVTPKRIKGFKVNDEKRALEIFKGRMP